MKETSSRPRVVIVGVGFGGLWALRTLARQAVDVLLIDRNNHHTFLPLLYQVAAAEIEPEAIAYPVRDILRRIPNARFLLAEAHHLDLRSQRLHANGHVIPYDYLILALGSTTHYFGVPGAAEYAFPLRVMADGITLRNQVLRCFERAEGEPQPAERQRLLTFVIVGGGPTGVEFAGALAELIHGPLRKDHPRLDFREVRVVLIEAQDMLLPALPVRLGVYARKRLEHMGVDVRLGVQVQAVRQDAVQLSDGTVLPTLTTVWTAGVQGAPEAHRWGLPTRRNGQVAVLPTLQVAGHPRVFVIGDLAYLSVGDTPLPMMAPVAVQQGRTAAENILRHLRGEPLRPFRYRDLGTMVTIGRNAAVAHVLGRTFTGFPAWVLWLGVHLTQLIGFRNRLLVLLNWAWDYLFFERTVRLILPSEEPPRPRR